MELFLAAKFDKIFKIDLETLICREQVQRAPRDTSRSYRGSSNDGYGNEDLPDL